MIGKREREAHQVSKEYSSGRKKVFRGEGDKDNPKMKEGRDAAQIAADERPHPGRAAGRPLAAPAPAFAKRIPPAPGPGSRAAVGSRSPAPPACKRTGRENTIFSQRKQREREKREKDLFTKKREREREIFTKRAREIEREQ